MAFRVGTGSVVAGLVVLWTGCQPAAHDIRPAGERPVPASPASAWPGGSYFGLNGTKIFHIPDDPAAVQRRLGWMKELGVRWDRCDLWWHVVEPQRGQFDFSRSDLAFETLETGGVQWYPILCYGAAWFESGRTAPVADQDFEDFANYVYRTVSRYRGRAPHWELWNEPNIAPFWTPEPKVDDYVRLLKAAYPAFKRADPNALLCAPAIAPLGWWDRTFVEGMYERGAKDYFDVFDYHYYRSHAPEEEVPRELAEIQAVMRRYGDDKPIQISESGVTTLLTGQRDAQRLQAAYVVRNHLLCLALGVKRFYYFDLQNWFDDRPDTWDSQLGLVTAAGERKQAFHAYRTMVAEVDGREIIGRLSDLDDGVEGVLFHDSATGGFRVALWAREPDGSTVVAVHGQREELTVVGPFGETTTTPATMAGAVGDATRGAPVTITANPGFVHPGDPMPYLPDAATRFSAALTILSPGESAPLRIEAHPRFAGSLYEPRFLVESVRSGQGVQWDPATQRLTCDADAQSGRVPIEAVIRVSYGPAGDRRTIRLKRTAEVEITPDLKLTIRPYKDGEKLRIDATVANRVSRPWDEPVQWIEETPDEQSRVIAAFPVAVDGHATRQVEIPVPAGSAAGRNAPCAWRLHYGRRASRPFRVHKVDTFGRQLVIDGDLSDWPDVPAVRVDQAEQVVRDRGQWSQGNASAGVRMTLDANTIYVAADVQDDDPMVNAETPNEIWRGDSIELFLGLAGPARRTVIDRTVDFQIGLAPDHGQHAGPVVFWFHRDVILTEAQVAARRTQTGYALEAAIPLTALMDRVPDLSDGTAIGFDITLNDLDSDDWAPAGNDPGRRLTWNGTDRNWIDPSNWGMAVIRR